MDNLENLPAETPYLTVAYVRCLRCDWKIPTVDVAAMERHTAECTETLQRREP